MSLRYRPEIDGLRAIAVTAVILFHGGVVPLRGGFAGVDVFFVISGFLVTSILLQDLAGGRHSIVQFYERRVRRIVPALVVVLLATTLAAWVLMIPSQLAAYSKSLLAVILFVSNLMFGANSGYFSPALEEAPLLHTWSLSIEEQYYLLFPLLLAVLIRRGPRAVTFGLWGMAGASLALAQWGAMAEPDFNFFFSLTRFWELLAGSLAAVASQRRKIAPNGALAAAGLALIGAALVLHGDRTPYPSLHSLLPVGGSVLVLLFASPQNLAGRILSLRPMVGVGLISYSAYLWHQPLFALLRGASTDAPRPEWMLGLTALTYALAWASWRLVEQPFRRKSNRWLPARKPLFASAAAGMTVLTLAAAAGIVSHGNDAAWRAREPRQAAVLDLVLEARQGTGLPADDGSCRVNLTGFEAGTLPRLRDCAARFGPAAVVLGDSHGIDLFNALKAAGRAPFLLGVTNGGCRPAEADRKCPFTAFADLVAAEPHLFAEILFVQSGAALLLGPDGREGSRQLFARSSAHAPVPETSVNAAALATIRDYLVPLQAHGVPVLWASPRIEPHVRVNRVLRQGCDSAYALRPGQAEAFARIDAEIAAVAVAAGLAHLPLAAYGFDITADLMSCEAIYWSDGDHWSTAGEARFGARLLPQLPGAFR